MFDLNDPNEIPSHLQSEARNGRAWRRTLKRRETTDRALRWLRSCARCGSIWPPIDLFCGDCAVELFSQQNRGSAVLQDGYEFPVYSLFTWTEANDSVIRPFVYGFKRGYSVRFAQKLCLRLLSEIGERSPLNARLVFPQSGGNGGKGQIDHAWLLANQFGQALRQEPSQIAGLRAIEEPKPRAQKYKSARARAERRFLPVEEFSRSSLAIVFVDDVITTGATARAAAKALGNHERFEAWTLVSRPKLAGTWGFW